jgi:hypothetical protein
MQTISTLQTMISLNRVKCMLEKIAMDKKFMDKFYIEPPWTDT